MQAWLYMLDMYFMPTYFCSFSLCQIANVWWSLFKQLKLLKIKKNLFLWCYQSGKGYKIVHWTHESMWYSSNINSNGHFSRNVWKDRVETGHKWSHEADRNTEGAAGIFNWTGCVLYVTADSCILLISRLMCMAMRQKPFLSKKTLRPH